MRRRLAELGVDPKEQVTRWTVDAAIDKISGKLPPWFERKIDEGLSALNVLKDELAKHKSQQPNTA